MANLGGGSLQGEVLHVNLEGKGDNPRKFMNSDIVIILG